MTKWCNDAVLDEGLEYIKTNCDKQIACASAPATYAEAIAGANALADVAMVSTDFTISDHASGGRKCVVGEQLGESIDTSGTATHIALVDTTTSTLIYVTECTNIYLTSGQTVDFPAWTIRIDDPA